MRVNRKTLATLYQISERTLSNYIKPFKNKLDRMATRINTGTKIIKLQRYNKAQLNFIVKKILQDTPEGYDLKEGRLIKITD